MNKTATTTEMLCAFVNQRAGLEFANYGDVKAYRSEQRTISNSRADFYELLALAQRRVSDFDSTLAKVLEQSNGRLTLEDGKLQYITGQYFPTEYRPAACRILSQMIWNDFRDEQEHNSPNAVYKDAQAMRKGIARNVSRRIMRNYFN